jgi:hypothetical protein
MSGDDEPLATPRTVWVFHGSHAKFASGVYDNELDAMEGVERHQLSGVVAEYPVGNGAYDLALAEGRFHPSKPHQGSPEPVASFSPGFGHRHVTAGKVDQWRTRADRQDRTCVNAAVEDDV